MGPRIVALVLGVLLFLAAVAGMTGLVRRAGHDVPVCKTAGAPCDPYRVLLQVVAFEISRAGQKKSPGGKEYSTPERI